MIQRDDLLLLALLFLSCSIKCFGELQHRKGIGLRRRIRRNDSTTMSMANVTCYIFNQPLDHYSPSTNEKIPQRYCIYSGYETLSQAVEPPIFFYTGNESPIEEYVNNTGLIWELAAKPSFGALVVFAEHRFQGESKPLYGSLSGGCFTYLTTSQALQDFASLISYLNPDHKRPVITFGGSYGGMLSSWMRMKYPGMIAGAISSSAPIWGFPLTLEGNITTKMKSESPNDGALDSAFHVVSEAIKVKVPGSNNQFGGDYCFDNLLAAWTLIYSYGTSMVGRKILSKEFNLCNPLDTFEDTMKLIDWAQSPWFDLAEANYPYKSSYVPYALGEGDYELPAWPLHEACVGQSGLNQDFGILFEGSKENVSYNVTYPSGLKLNVDWDQVNVLQRVEAGGDSATIKLLRSVKDAIGLWFNITQKVECFDVVPAINDNGLSSVNAYAPNLRFSSTSRRQQEEINEASSIDQICTEKIENETVWTSIVCNENLNLIMTYARGVGRDFFWPPSHPKHQVTYRDTLSNWTVVEQNFASVCSDPDEVFGYPKKDRIDPFSKFFDDMYGGKRIGSHSNIIFSNGLLDPWAAAGVYSSRNNYSNDAEDLCLKQGIDGKSIEYPCSMVQNITKDGRILSIILDLGGHHLDLMFSSDEDPQCATLARKLEEFSISEWITEWTSGNQYKGKECKNDVNL